MLYDCIRCLAATDNDYDICDNCLEETKNNEALMRAAEGFVRLGAEIERLRAELASERNHVAGLRVEIARLREALNNIAALDVPRPVWTRHRADGEPSKYDRCAHVINMWDDCSICISDYARVALAEQEKTK